jgi:hypothetical protein
MLDKLTIDDFTPRIGETFTATPQEGEALELELRRAESSPYGSEEGAERAPFSIEFHSGLPQHVPQQTFAIEHGEMGRFDLFLVPLGPDGEGHRYEAVFG